MIKFTTKFSLGFCLECKRIRETVKAESKVLKVVKAITRTRQRKL